METLNYQYSLLHYTLFNQPLAQACAGALTQQAASKNINLGLPNSRLCSHCSSVFVPGWNLLVRIKYLGGNKKKKNKKHSHTTADKQSKRQRVLVYTCLVCHHRTQFDNLIQENQISNLLNPNAEVSKNTKVATKTTTTTTKTKTVATSTSTVAGNKSKVKLVGADGKITKAQQKKKKKKLQFTKKEVPKKKESLSLFDFMSQD